MLVFLLNLPTKNRQVVRDMAGGLGFDGGDAVILPPLELAYLASSLREKNIEVLLSDADIDGYSSEDIITILKGKKPDCVITTVSLPSLYADCAIIKELRAYTKAKIFIQTNIFSPSLLKQILDKSAADACVYGECETNIHKILLGEETRGIAYIKDGSLVVGEKFILEDLDKLPLPARDLLKNDRYHYGLLGNKTTTIQTSRGCPFPCSYYCPYPLVQGHAWRARSPEHIIREIADIVTIHNIHNILFRDATFTLDKKRVHAICDLIIERKFFLRWWCETRVDCLSEELIKKMKAAGCAGINVGVESGDPLLMQSQAKRGLTLEMLGKIRNVAKKIGIKLHFLFLVGLPDETKKSLYATYKLICELRPESIGVCIITPYPGTPLYDDAKKNNWIETEDWVKFGGHTPIMHTNNLSSDDLRFGQKMLLDGYYINKKFGRLGFFVYNKIFQNWAEK